MRDGLSQGPCVGVEGVDGGLEAVDQGLLAQTAAAGVDLVAGAVALGPGVEVVLVALAATAVAIAIVVPVVIEEVVVAVVVIARAAAATCRASLLAEHDDRRDHVPDSVFLQYNERSRERGGKKKEK